MASGLSTLIIGKGGTIFSCGYNNVGQLGLGTTGNNPNYFQEVTEPSGVTFISVCCGQEHSVALGKNGIVYACGSNSSGQFGNGTNTNNSTFTPATPSWSTTYPYAYPVSIYCGGNSTFVLLSNNTIWCCGDNSDGQLGLGTGSSTNYNTFQQMIMPSGYTPQNISCGYYNYNNLNLSFTSVLMTDGTIWSCGDNSSGQFGNNTTNSSYSLTQMTVPSGLTPQSISCGGNFIIVLMSNGSIYGCGSNTYGQLGFSNEPYGAYNTLQLMPLPSVPSGLIPQSISCGDQHTIVLMTNGSIYGCGYGYYGQLGNGNNSNNNYPLTEMTIPSSSTTTLIPYSISCSQNSTFVQMTDGTVYSCGYGQYGQLGIGSIVTIETTLTLTQFAIPPPPEIISLFNQNKVIPGFYVNNNGTNQNLLQLFMPLSYNDTLIAPYKTNMITYNNINNSTNQDLQQMFCYTISSTQPIPYDTGYKPNIPNIPDLTNYFLNISTPFVNTYNTNNSEFTFNYSIPSSGTQNLSKGFWIVFTNTSTVSSFTISSLDFVKPGGSLTLMAVGGGGGGGGSGGTNYDSSECGGGGGGAGAGWFSTATITSTGTYEISIGVGGTGGSGGKNDGGTGGNGDNGGTTTITLNGNTFLTAQGGGCGFGGGGGKDGVKNNGGSGGGNNTNFGNGGPGSNTTGIDTYSGGGPGGNASSECYGSLTIDGTDISYYFCGGGGGGGNHVAGVPNTYSYNTNYLQSGGLGNFDNYSGVPGSAYNNWKSYNTNPNSPDSPDIPFTPTVLFAGGGGGGGAPTTGSNDPARYGNNGGDGGQGVVVLYYLPPS